MVAFKVAWRPEAKEIAMWYVLPIRLEVYGFAEYHVAAIAGLS